MDELKKTVRIRLCQDHKTASGFKINFKNEDAMALKDAAENLNTWQYTIFNRKKGFCFLFQLNLSTML